MLSTLHYKPGTVTVFNYTTLDGTMNDNLNHNSQQHPRINGQHYQLSKHARLFYQFFAHSHSSRACHACWVLFKLQCTLFRATCDFVSDRTTTTSDVVSAFRPSTAGFTHGGSVVGLSKK